MLSSFINIDSAEFLYQPIFTTIERTNSTSDELRKRKDQDDKITDDEVRSVHSCPIDLRVYNSKLENFNPEYIKINVEIQDSGYTEDSTSEEEFEVYEIIELQEEIPNKNDINSERSYSSADGQSSISSSPLTSINSDCSLNDNSFFNVTMNTCPTVDTIRCLIERSTNCCDPKKLFSYIQELLVVICWTNMNGFFKNETNLKKSLVKTVIRNLKYLTARNIADAGYLLADVYSSGLFGIVDNKKAYIYFRNAAHAGHAEASFRTAYCYERGLGVEASASKALKYLEYAAKQRHNIAMFKLGMAYFYEKLGARKNDSVKLAGITWLSRAVNCSDGAICDAPYELGKIYEKGYKDLLLKDEMYAKLLFEKAKSLGYVSSNPTK